MKSDIELIERILEGIYYEETGATRASQQGFDETDVFVERYFNEDFAEIIFNSLKKDVDLYKVATLLDVLVWSTPDNGSKLERLLEDWIASDNKTKVAIILLRQDWFPRQDQKENLEVLEKVKLKFPELTDLCNYHRDEFDYHKKTGFRRIHLLSELAARTRQF